MLKLLFRFVVYIGIFILLVGGIGTYGEFRSQKNFYGNIRQEAVPSLEGMQKPQHDSAKPTVAVILGNGTTEGLDFTIPYQLFSMTGAYNVYAVAADDQVKSLTGGLDVMPHYSFQQLDGLLGKSPDIIAIPYMTNAKNEELVTDWILKHQDTTLLSICAGAGNLAATGLLDGKLGATHWQTMGYLTKEFPEVKWQEDKRYVTNGENMVSSAGISSGIDATLYVISKKLGEPVAEKVAKEMNYPSYHFVKNPTVDPFYKDWRFSTYVLNNMFQWNKTEAGVLLYNGVEEMALASVFDIYSDSGTSEVHSITSTDAPVVTKHGLNLISRFTMSDAPKLDKMIVPGMKARTLATDELHQWNEVENTKELRFAHSDSPDRFIFEVQLEDLAKQEDILTAKHAVKRLEYRATDIHLEGNAVPFETYFNLLLTVFVALLIASYIDRRFILKRNMSKQSM
ncbi:DJ-1/PfpI family protein [Ammoniphilus sp. CFH 90114]|uniref:DJ-1/PfpI family protein n=1 Tax=Ammoniphilus sp. CFH 90114 TaxID=2493665 RepID=UPI00100E74F7|nr:DJ-1/PfpI family protein [Ammoniphilus sp. CFH 90114]RXT02350.1 DJ-1/PfpI family protein [Ammoniphilus sp. CFH 90114]